MVQQRPHRLGYIYQASIRSHCLPAVTTVRLKIGSSAERGGSARDTVVPLGCAAAQRRLGRVQATLHANLRLSVPSALQYTDASRLTSATFFHPLLVAPSRVHAQLRESETDC